MNRPVKNVGSNSPVFDGNEAVVWIVNMTSNCADARVKHITPGVLYTFVFMQDAVGGNVFTWPSQCANAPEVSTAPNKVTTANFIGVNNAEMAANIPATWT